LPRYYLGIDGGQSSTTALVANESGAVIGIGRSGPCNHVTGAEAREKFRRVIGECIDQATRTLEHGAPEFAAACLGFSGGAEDKLGYARELIRTPRLKVTNDAEIALIGAHAGQPGIIIIAGTGSIAFGRNAEGRMARAGGWGYIYGDEGGAFDLVRQALRASLQLEEGWGSETIVREKLLAATGQPSANALLHHFYTQPRHEIAKLASLVTECAKAGDSIAAGILREAARQLASYVGGVHRNLFAAAAAVPVAYIGGVFQSAPLRITFAEYIRTQIGTEPVRPRLSPAAGALLEALRLDGNFAQLTGIPDTKT
jgi:N-acetylglucosamine kinase-like BadF-type ATPase